jgi:hypothetical protein
MALKLALSLALILAGLSSSTIAVTQCKPKGGGERWRDKRERGVYGRCRRSSPKMRSVGKTTLSLSLLYIYLSLSLFFLGKRRKRERGRDRGEIYDEDRSTIHVLSLSLSHTLVRAETSGPWRGVPALGFGNELIFQSVNDSKLNAAVKAAGHSSNVFVSLSLRTIGHLMHGYLLAPLPLCGRTHSHTHTFSLSPHPPPPRLPFFPFLYLIYLFFPLLPRQPDAAFSRRNPERILGLAHRLTNPRPRL